MPWPVASSGPQRGARRDSSTRPPASRQARARSTRRAPGGTGRVRCASIPTSSISWPPVGSAIPCSVASSASGGKVREPACMPSRPAGRPRQGPRRATAGARPRKPTVECRSASNGDGRQAGRSRRAGCRGLENEGRRGQPTQADADAVGVPGQAGREDVFSADRGEAGQARQTPRTASPTGSGARRQYSIRAAAPVRLPRAMPCFDAVAGQRPRRRVQARARPRAARQRRGAVRRTRVEVQSRRVGQERVRS